MSYYNDEEQYDIECEQAEQEFNNMDKLIDGDFKMVEKRMKSMMSEIQGSANPFLMMNIDSAALLNFVYTEKCEEPKRYVPRDGNDIYIQGPMDIDEVMEACYGEQETEWVVCRSEKQQHEYERQQQEWLEENKEHIEAEQQKKEEEQKQKELVEKAKANQFNWTLPAELRGIVKKKQQKPKVSKSQRRKNRRKTYQVNKTLPPLPSQKKTGGFRVNRSNPAKM